MNDTQASFFHQHGSTTSDAQQKYNSRAAQMYRERLHSLAIKALKTQDRKVIIVAVMRYQQEAVL